MNIKKSIKEKFGDEMSGYVYTGHQELEEFYTEVWNKAIAAAAAAGYKRLYDIGEYEELVEEAILKLKK